MRFDLDDDQRAVRDGIDSLCRSAWSPASARRHGAGDDDAAALWRELVAAGWPGIAVAQAYGGQGLGTVELTLVCETMGRALAPGMFFGNAAVAALVEGAGDDDQRQRWLPGFASGEARGALGSLQPDGTGLALDAEGAAALVLVGGGRAMLVAAGDCQLEPAAGVDLTRRLSSVTLTGGTDELRGDLGTALERVEVALSAELVGVAQRALDLALDQARSRQQFGRPIGAYQAVSHRCADMLLDVESARSAVLAAAWTADHSPQALPFAASVAKVSAAQGAWRVTTASLQVHGGIGFTWEHDCHLLLRRAVASGHLLGSPEAHLDRVAAARGLGGAAAVPTAQ
ncbi:MAG: acyl-CoA/acyl-ACP dehydrogenase [Candidatus Dormibacteraeota bacterium]|uniref:Acyl-CoA/acyl-ACP dehydrogenase n=1 Tax=Candidatus Amunia macphersoniae TaxID=3127014 RepID=A0A934KJU0_9BACT|nr:acyl-CoA/acyl-ACP dehydrogenase [Candidatus Dormibacteraeota bacterium]